MEDHHQILPQVLMLHLEPPDSLDMVGRAETWVGLTQGVSATGADFSRKQFIEIWINDFQERTDNVRMSIDLGTVSEDALWEPGVAASLPAALVGPGAGRHRHLRDLPVRPGHHRPSNSPWSFLPVFWLGRRSFS